ncbi:MAG TPA: disulfide bond formation protein B [Candidatus Kapabacteria bacterium]|nr:disulfide bond formation protein B [Candidatus Kapabacteria bacterium]
MSESAINMLNTVLSFFTLLGHIGIGGFLIAWWLKEDRVLSIVRRHGLFLSFGVALAATFLSLIYSNIIGYEPCILCWYQRIFMYPLVVLFGIALWKKDTTVVRYALPLAVLGGLIGLFQYYGQFFNASALDVCGAGPSCAQLFFVGFGYITIPLMSLTSFVLIILFMMVLKRGSSERP